MLLALVLGLLVPVASLMLNDVQNTDIFHQPGDPVQLEAVADDWFGRCSLKNNRQQTICSVTFKSYYPYSPVPQCKNNTIYTGDGSKFKCKFQINNIQNQGNKLYLMYSKILQLSFTIYYIKIPSMFQILGSGPST